MYDVCSENLRKPMCYANINKEKGVSFMNLKEAFRFQNKLKVLSQAAGAILSVPGQVTKVETTYLRKKVMPEAEDEVVSEPLTPWGERINEMVDFLVYLLDQRAALGRAIRTAKAGMELDMDLETGLNSQRQGLASTLRAMASLSSSESLVPGGGTGYRFNAEGNQVTYRCDIRKVTTIIFDRNKVRKLAAKLYQQADATSTRLDVALVTTQVDYQPPFDINDTFESVFEQFCEEHKQS